MALSWRQEGEEALASSLIHALPLEQLDAKSVNELLSETFNGGADRSVYTERLDLLLQEVKKQLNDRDSSLSDIDLGYAMFMVTDLVKGSGLEIEDDRYKRLRYSRNHHAHKPETWTDLSLKTQLRDIVEIVDEHLKRSRCTGASFGPS